MARARRRALVAGAAAAAGALGAVLRATARRAAWAPVGEAPEGLVFPPGFRFGAATSAHQVEGDTTNNSWTRWEEHVRPDGRGGIFTGERCGKAVDHWSRFEDDVDLMTALGIDTYRFSVEWSRIEPREGVFDDAALDRYRSWCTTLRAAGIAPMITLQHFTEPLWLTDQGGFEERTAVDAFVRFVEHVVPALADVCDWWVTINEPAVYAVNGWLNGEFPPAKQDVALAGRVLEHLLLAHARAYHTLHEHDRVDADGDGIPCWVSLATNVVAFEPRHTWNPADVAAAKVAHANFNVRPLDACVDGRFRFGLPGLGRHVATHAGLAGTLDYVGVNHYFRALVSVNPRAPAGLEVGFDDVTEKNDMGWDLIPATLGEAVSFVARYDKPVLITEHGTCDGAVPDRRRRAFLLDSLHVLAHCIRDGADVRGYLHWSLMDNFEWAHGFQPRFGLYRVDYDTFERTLTGGGDLYRGVIAEHRARTGPPPAP
jgi:beta-glucosidase